MGSWCNEKIALVRPAASLTVHVCTAESRTWAVGLRMCLPTLYPCTLLWRCEPLPLRSCGSSLGVEDRWQPARGEEPRSRRCFRLLSSARWGLEAVADVHRVLLGGCVVGRTWGWSYSCCVMQSRCKLCETWVSFTYKLGKCIFSTPVFASIALLVVRCFQNDGKGAGDLALMLHLASARSWHWCLVPPNLRADWKHMHQEHNYRVASLIYYVAKWSGLQSESVHLVGRLRKINTCGN